WEPLADLGGFAESYARPDPVSALVKLRSFGELLVHSIFERLKLPRRPLATFNDLLAEDSFQAVTPRVVLAKLHALRKEGNGAAHGQQAEVPTSLWLLKEAFDLGCWLHLTYGGGTRADFPAFSEPPSEDGTTAKAPPSDKKTVLERLAAQEALLERVLAELEAARSQTRLAATSAAELEHASSA